MEGGAAWGPPASPDRLAFLGKEGGLTGDRRDRTLIQGKTITGMEMLQGNSAVLSAYFLYDRVSFL
ncbi:MAG: hypothetical protein A2W03_01840 [Candidatus Aminicenantes bacterium RBG_16_63_16]|nr:MAG: hypothetical protein A2W03_01840 [Candidatus Aminicenantes bacterium RBG_16_63_16]